MSNLGKNYINLVIGAAERNWDNNQKKMEAKGISKESYILGYLHGYQACFDVYDLDPEQHPKKK